MRLVIEENKYRHQGFTLIEMAIVLLVAGVLTAGIWTAGQAAWNSYQVYKVNQQMMQVAQSIREFYRTVTVLPVGSAGDITSLLYQKNVIPGEMNRLRGSSANNPTPPIDHALNNSYPPGASAPQWGSFHVFNACPGSGAATACFRIALQGLTQQPCIRLLTTVPFTEPSYGIIQVGTQGMTVGEATIDNQGNVTSGGDAQLPSQILFLVSTWCIKTDNTNEVDFDFRLQD